METFTVRSGDIRIPVSVAGDGPRAMFVPGMSITQARLGELIEELRRFLQLATFDLRGHGQSDAADQYGYEAFAADEHVATLREIDVHRRSATERSDAVACPVTMIMSTTLAGADGARARELNHARARGVDDLVATHPAIEVHRLPGGHDLPLVHPRTVAEIVHERLERL